MTDKALLTLEDETIITGDSFGFPGSAAGELVFTTGMVGYPETLTDPSYKGQILIFTYPLIGNYGINQYENDQFGLPIGFESDRIQVSGVIVSECCEKYSHHKASRSISDWLKAEKIPGIFNVDTRELTKKLRVKGSMLGKIETGKKQTNFFDPNSVDLAGQVTVADVETIYANSPDDKSAPTVVVVDCGSKANIIRSLLKRGLNVIRVPYDYYFLNLDFDGLVLSNGPGDPKMYQTTIRNVERALAVGKPIFGICLGHQILARAVGAETYKMKFGHRSHNQPCLIVSSGSKDSRMAPGRCYITSQNHGYAVRDEGLPSDWEVWFKNGNDDSIEGIRHRKRPFASVQFHPEATPGPVDTAFLFDHFAKQVKKSETKLFQL